MNEIIERYIEEKHAGADLKEHLRKLQFEDAASVTELIRGLNPSANTLRGLLDLAGETVLRDNLSLTEVLERAGTNRILAHEKLSRKEKQKQVRLALEELRYPEISSIKKELLAGCKAIARDTGLLVHLPADLEGEGVSVNLVVRSREEGEEAARKLERLARHPALADILRILSGSY